MLQKEQFYLIRLSNKFVFAVLVFLIAGSGLVLWRIVETNVYAQSEMVARGVPFAMPLPKLLSWVVRGGLFSVIISILRRKYHVFKSLQG